MKNVVKHSGRMAAGILPAALLAQLGWPAFALLAFLAVLGLGVFCWTIASGDRSDRVIRMILARRGDARCLQPGNSAISSPASRQRRQRLAQRPETAHPGSDTAGQPDPDSEISAA